MIHFELGCHVLHVVLGEIHVVLLTNSACVDVAPLNPSIPCLLSCDGKLGYSCICNGEH